MRPLAVVLALAMLAPAGAAAQNRVLDIERFRPSPDRSGYLGIPGTRTPGEWAWNAALFASYSSEPLTLRRLDDGSLVPIVAHRVGADLVAQLGVLDRIAVVIDAPMVVWQDVDAEPLDAGPAVSAVALRDPFVAARVRVLGEGGTANHERVDGGGLALQLGVTLPFGHENQLAGEGSPQLEGRVIGDFHFLDFAVAAEVGYRHRFAEPRILGVLFGNELFFGAAVQTPTFVVQNLTAIVEVRVTTALDQEAFTNASTAVEGDLGARWAEDDVALTWAVGMGFNGGVGTPGVRGIFGIEFAPRTHDIDHDGLIDDQDQCERLPEDVDGYMDDDGCPDLDNDGDLIPDDDDRCPLETADFDRDQDEDGCTDPVRDADGDGVTDGDDACPREPEDADGHEDDDGCPDVDNDGDGVADAVDACRDEPEDADGFQDEDGCPDLDDDDDGVPDTADACPRQAEDRDEHEDADGCPDPDDDRDGVLDAQDRCPEEPETINGVDDDDGCPDRGGRALWRIEAADRPDLLGRIRFAADGSIPAISAGAVAQLARHLVARWGSQVVITIGADDPARRDALRTALIERGAPPGGFAVTSDGSVTGWTVRVHAAAAP